MGVFQCWWVSLREEIVLGACMGLCGQALKVSGPQRYFTDRLLLLTVKSGDVFLHAIKLPVWELQSPLVLQNTLEAYPCGSDHTPSPMASRVAVEVETILDSPSAQLTAVAVSVRPGHTIAFLGDSKGNLHKVPVWQRSWVCRVKLFKMKND